MNLIIDIGNSFTKAVVFSKSDIIYSTCAESINIYLIEEIARSFPVKKGIISSVSLDVSSLVSRLKEKLNLLILADQNTPVPLKNLYITRETLGFDRLASAVGAYTIFPDANVLVIDIGTAITIDMVTAKGEYLGGNISPGIEIRFRALHTFTKKLPLVKKTGKTGLTGKTTEDAIRFGVYNGVNFELNGYIEAYLAKFEKLITILTGGDHKYFVKKLKSSIFVDSNLNLKGLNAILQYNDI